jgi:tripartite-type tricarboxylate transporter receptor subunit TctC
MQRRTLIQAAGASAAALAAPMLRAQPAWPNGPVRIVVGFPPGGGTDALARVVAAKLTEMWKQQVIVENKAGVAGVLAAEYTASQPSDGSVLLMAHINSHALAASLQPKLRYNIERDFVPIVLVGVTPNLLIANPSQPKTVPEIVALCKANPGGVSFGSAGAGSAQHLALEMFKLQAKVDALHVPYKGSGPLLTDLIGGQIQYCFETMTAATPHVKGGRVVAIAQTRTKRAKGHPNVPTMQEAGFEGFEATTWYGLVGPGKLPAAIADKVNADVNTVLAMPDVQEKMDTYGAEDGGGTREKFRQFIASETAKWAKVVKDGNVKVDT